MSRALRTAASLAATAAAALAVAAPAAGSARQESIFMDDNELLYVSGSHTESRIAAMKALGADRLRVSVFWRGVAPRPTSTARPSFDAANPSAYPASAWDRYDRLLQSAQRHGVGVLFTVVGPAPLWATSDPSRGSGVLRPRADEFRAFVTALGRRYSGGWVDERPQAPPPPAPPPQDGGGGGGGGGGGFLPIFPRSAAVPTARSAAATLPRVSHWSIWNEPNQPGWLSPQMARRVPASPRAYRALANAAFAGLRASGHGGDLILFGETAPRGVRRPSARGPMRPLVFVRELYCLDRRLRPYRGRRARARRCPTNRAGRRRFASRNPGLFRIRGFAHHPYALEAPPERRDPIRDQVTVSTLSRLTRTLDRAFRRNGRRRRLPIWLTEYGYQTNPPDPVIGVSWRRQAAWINDGEAIAYRNRRVRATTQFLLVDDRPDTRYPPSSLRYWGSTFQSGFITREGRRKPAFVSYQKLISVLPRRVRRGRRVRLVGQLRPARNGALLSARVEFRRRGSRRWRTVRRVRTRNRRNYLTVRLRVRRAGVFRLVWRNPSGRGVIRTRAVPVSVRARRRR